MTTITKAVAVAPVAPVAVTKTSLAAAVTAGSKSALEMKTSDQVEIRAEIINRAYSASKADHALKAKVFIYYVTQIKKRGLSLREVLPFFETEIKAAFDNKTLRETSTDETTKEKVDAKVVFASVRRMFSQAEDRFSRAGGKSKGPDEAAADPLAAIRAMFEQKSLTNLADAFWQLKNMDRKQSIIKALFDKLDRDVRVALYLELEATINAEETEDAE